MRVTDEQLSPFVDGDTDNLVLAEDAERIALDLRDARALLESLYMRVRLGNHQAVYDLRNELLAEIEGYWEADHDQS